MPLRPKAKLKAWRRKVGRPRVNQFADDLGISRREALNLMNKGRRRKDGGSNVLENSMKKMKGYNEGGANRRSTDPEPTIKLTDEQKEELEALGYGDEPPFYDTLPLDMDDARPNPEGAPQKLPLKTNQRAKGSGRKASKSGEKAYETYGSGGSMKVKGYSGGGMNCRGGGAAIQGTKFSGEF